MGAVAALTTSTADWTGFPQVLIGPLVYWVLLCSVAAYFLVTWATRHLPPSQVRITFWQDRTSPCSDQGMHSWATICETHACLG